MRTHKTVPSQLDILIVEDDPDIRAVLRFLLEGAGYTCAEAADGYEALDLARQCPPRLALLDLMMPELDGLATAKQLQSEARTRQIHLYCITAREDPAARREAQRVGCEVFLTKPVDAAALLDVVSVVLNS